MLLFQFDQVSHRLVPSWFLVRDVLKLCCCQKEPFRVVFSKIIFKSSSALSF